MSDTRQPLKPRRANTRTAASRIRRRLSAAAAGQVGMHPENKESYGNSMIVDPWGEVLARAGGEGESFVAADLDLQRQDEVREKLPSLANRVPGAYRWPEPQEVPA